VARAKGFDAQRLAIGPEQTALVAALREVAAGHVKIVPDVQVGGDSGVISGLAALLMRSLATDATAATDRLSGAAGNGEVGGVLPPPAADEPAVHS
jgi:hypothetical protein